MVQGKGKLYSDLDKLFGEKKVRRKKKYDAGQMF